MFSMLSSFLCAFTALHLSLLLFPPPLVSWIHISVLFYILCVLSLSISSMSHFAESSPAQTDSYFEADEWATAGWKQGFDPGCGPALAVHWTPRVGRAIASPPSVDLLPSTLPGRSLLLLTVQTLCHANIFLRFSEAYYTGSSKHYLDIVNYKFCF